MGYGMYLGVPFVKLALSQENRASPRTESPCFRLVYEKILEKDVPMHKIPRWFIGAKLNYAENLLQHRDSKLALIGVGESPTTPPVTLTYAELYDQVRKCAHALKKVGVKSGDRVAAYISNAPETVVAMLATASLGAVWSSASPDFGHTGVLDRFTQIEPKVLFSVNAVVYNGKAHDHLHKLKSVVEGLPTVEKVVVVEFVKGEKETDLSDIPKAELYTNFLKSGDDQKPLEFEQVPFNHPLYILYSSGTTGKPKCIVHSVGGALIQHKKEHQIHGSLNRDDVYFYYTTQSFCTYRPLSLFLLHPFPSSYAVAIPTSADGVDDVELACELTRLTRLELFSFTTTIVWIDNSGLAIGCTLVLYDGSPFKPTPARLWELVDQFGITAFGTSAKYIQSLQEAGYKPRDNFSLSTLHSIYSTGSPLKPESFEYVYDSIKKDVLLGSITGGTDIVSLFAGHNSTLPVYKGEIQCRMLGMSVFAWDEGEAPVYDAPGDL
ncbi:hypothetical protein HK102_007736, partial [Quaeritorhiza haematococci]